MKTIIGLQDDLFVVMKDLLARGFLVRITFSNGYIYGMVSEVKAPHLPLLSLSPIAGQNPLNVENFINELARL